MPVVAGIVNHHIATGWAHFADEPLPEDGWVADWEADHERYPWLVAERDGVGHRSQGLVAGIAWGKSFNARAAYAWTAEVSVYLREQTQGQGIGTALYERLIPTLDAQGYRCLMSGITLPNEGSVRLHERFGFVHLGTLERVGYKMGAWRNVGSWQRLTGPMDDSEPAPLRPVSEVWQDD
jgi:phosphinothricin acetyltransferase